MKNTTRTLPALVLALMLAVAPKIAATETITVSAAASLIDAFQAIAREYEVRHPDDTVQLNFAASGTLLQQIDKGAPVDILATADTQTMDMAEAKGLIVPESRRVFTGNSLVVVQPPGASSPITSLTALHDANVQRIAIGNSSSVPAGRYALMALEAAGLWTTLQGRMIFTLNVRQALDYVARGEVDAAFVYGSDAHAMAHRVHTGMRVPLSSPIEYPIARVVNGSGGAKAADRFLTFVVSPYGQSVLVRHGFEPVTP